MLRCSASAGGAVEIAVGTAIPRSNDDPPYVDASMTVLLETSPEMITAKVLRAEKNTLLPRLRWEQEALLHCAAKSRDSGNTV